MIFDLLEYKSIINAYVLCNWLHIWTIKHKFACTCYAVLLQS